MIRLAVNDSPVSRSLLQSGELEIDFLETTGPLVETAITDVLGTPLLLHNSIWDWSLAHPQALEQQEFLPITRRRLEQTGAPWLSVHLGFSANTVCFDAGMRPVSAPLESGALVPTFVRNIRELRGSLDVPLLLENLDYNPTGAYDHICDPQFIKEVLEASDSYLLLDLAHAQVSAFRLGFDLDEYLSRLPLARVRQIHISSPRLHEGDLVDTHEPLMEHDSELLREVLAKASPWAVTLEYSKDANALLTQVGNLKKLLSAL